MQFVREASTCNEGHVLGANYSRIVKCQQQPLISLPHVSITCITTRVREVAIGGRVHRIRTAPTTHLSSVVMGFRLPCTDEPHQVFMHDTGPTCNRVHQECLQDCRTGRESGWSAD